MYILYRAPFNIVAGEKETDVIPCFDELVNVQPFFFFFAAQDLRSRTLVAADHILDTCQLSACNPGNIRGWHPYITIISYHYQRCPTAKCTPYIGS